MAEERIIIVLDDSQLQAVTLNIRQVSTVARSTFGAGVMRRGFSSGLPAVNRELRLILGQLPGMRQVMQSLFLFRRLERGFAIGGVQSMLGIAATVVILIQSIKSLQRQFDRIEDRLDKQLMASRGFTEKELKREKIIWKYFLKSDPL